MWRSSTERSPQVSETSSLIITLENGVKRITINRPERRNAVDNSTIRALRDAFVSSADDDSRVIVLTGAGDAFCAGADLQTSISGNAGSFTETDVTKVLREGVNPVILAMRALPKPIIARVHGHAVGVGANFALACDLVLASDKALFSQIFAKIGLMPDGGGTYFLPRLVGYHKAFELMATAELVSAESALALGLVNRVVAASDLDGEVAALAARLAAGPGVAYAQMKAGLNHALGSDLAGALDFEAVHQGVCFRSADFVEGVTAFLEKRKAAFTGK